MEKIQIRISKDILSDLDKFKIHPDESYDAIIRKLINVVKQNNFKMPKYSVNN